MKLTKSLLFSLILVSLATPAPAADINAASCSRADVQAAIDLAVDGVRVLVPAGSCTWSQQVLVDTKGITLEGAGIGVTTITNNVISVPALKFYLLAGNSTTYVTGFTFDGNNVDTLSVPFIGLKRGGLNAFRVHHNEFINMRGRSIMPVLEGLEVTGLIDNNTFKMPGTGDSKAIELVANESQNSDGFDRPFALGSDKFIFIEDNTFDYGGKNDGAMDTSGGARYVFRYNTVKNTLIGHHGADSGSYRGVHSFEIYENTFDRTVAGNIRRVYFRSGSGVVYNNTWTGNYGSAQMNNFRSCGNHPPWGTCTGSSSWDENQSGKEGYACLDQIGHVFTENETGDNVLQGLYWWSNPRNGDPTIGMNVYPLDCSRVFDLHIIEDRDWYDQGASFDGTSGVGVGTLANRPSTCTPQVGYWATDESKLYRCTATDTWTFHYTPFTYPHPLQGGGNGDPPTNLRVIVR